MKDYRNLSIWEKSHSIVLSIYQTTLTFPKSEVYGLSSQMRRSASSVPTNIAEGCGRNSDAELRRFLVIAHGSASELSYQLFLALELKYIPQEDFETLNSKLIEVMKMLNSFIQKLSN